MTDILSRAETTADFANGVEVASAPRSIFDSNADLAPYRLRWQQRCEHYGTLRAYYAGTVYDDRPELVTALQLYSGIRQIFGPLRRAVRIDTAKVPAGWALDPGDAVEDRAAVPPDVAAAVRQIRRWSRYRSTYSRAVLHGAVAGEFGLMVIDDRRAATVAIVALRPDEVVTGQFADGTPFGLVIKPGRVDRSGSYEYAQLITPTEYKTFRNGAPHDYDGAGASRPNLLGFVPLLLSPYLAGENGIGENAFAGTQELLDRVNDAASQVLDVIQRNAEPLVIFSGVTEVEVETSDNAITLPPADAKAYTLVPNLVIDQALALIQEVKAEFKNQLPQLILDVLASRNDLAFDTVLTLCMELIDHIRDVRTHVDAAIEQAERWALVAGNQMQLWNVEPALHGLDPNRYVIEPTPGARLALDQQAAQVEAARRPAAEPAKQPSTTPQEEK